MARRGGRRGGRRRGRSRNRRSRSRASSSKSRKSTRNRRARSTAASKRKSVRSKAKANRNRRRSLSTKSKAKTKKKGFKSRVKSIRKSISKTVGKVKKGFSMGRKAYGGAAASIGGAIGKATRGAAANAASHVANSRYTKQLRKANWTKRDMSKLTPQQQRKYQRLSEKTGRDYSIRKPTFRLNLSADTLAKFGGFSDSKAYKGITSRFPGIKKLKINKQFYGNPMKKGWHSSQRTGRGQGLTDKQRLLAEQISRSSHPEFVHSRRDAAGLPSLRMDTEQIPPQFGRAIRGIPRPIPLGAEPDWLGDYYRTYNIGGEGGKLDDAARDYWSNEAKTKGRTATLDIIRGTARDQGTWGGMSEEDEARIAKIPKGSRTNWKGRVIDRRRAGKPGTSKVQASLIDERKRRGKPHFRSGPKWTDKAQVTYGGRNKPQRINTGSRPTGTWRGIPIGPRPLRTTYPSKAERARRKANLQNKGAKRRMAKSLAAHMGTIRGGVG